MARSNIHFRLDSSHVVIVSHSNRYSSHVVQLMRKREGNEMGEKVRGRNELERERESLPVSSTLLMPFFSIAIQAMTGTSPSSRIKASQCFFTPSSYSLSSHMI